MSFRYRSLNASYFPCPYQVVYFRKSLEFPSLLQYLRNFSFGHKRTWKKLSVYFKYFFNQLCLSTETWCISCTNTLWWIWYCEIYTISIALVKYLYWQWVVNGERMAGCKRKIMKYNRYIRFIPAFCTDNPSEWYK